MKVKVISLGCKVNQYEAQALENTFLENGFSKGDDFADIIIVNSCTVTSLADRKTRQLIRKFRRELPNGVIVLTGCMPQASPQPASSLLEADIITGTKDKKEIFDLVQGFLENKLRTVKITPYSDAPDFEDFNVSCFDDSFQRAYLKVQDGCDRFCSYCIVPKARGAVRSRPPADITKEAVTLANKGYKELVITGVNLARYGADLALTLADAVEAVAAASGDFRIRLGSVEHDLLTKEDWQRLAKVEKLCPHFHLPLQSGCDKTLQRMNRRYTSSEFLETVCYIKSLFSNPSFSTDVIVGFPNESDEDFLQSCETFKKAEFFSAHIFEYSPRATTPAAEMENQVAPQIKKQRHQALTALAKVGYLNFANAQVGKTAQVLLEATGGGYTENYLYVKVKNAENFNVGDVITVKITTADQGVATAVGL